MRPLDELFSSLFCSGAQNPSLFPLPLRAACLSRQSPAAMERFPTCKAKNERAAAANQKCLGADQRTTDGRTLFMGCLPPPPPLPGLELNLRPEPARPPRCKKGRIESFLSLPLSFFLDAISALITRVANRNLSPLSFPTRRRPNPKKGSASAGRTACTVRPSVSQPVGRLGGRPDRSPSGVRPSSQ